MLIAYLISKQSACANCATLEKTKNTDRVQGHLFRFFNLYSLGTITSHNGLKIQATRVMNGVHLGSQHFYLQMTWVARIPQNHVYILGIFDLGEWVGANEITILKF